MFLSSILYKKSRWYKCKKTKYFFSIIKDFKYIVIISLKDWKPQSETFIRNYFRISVYDKKTKSFKFLKYIFEFPCLYSCKVEICISFLLTCLNMLRTHHQVLDCTKITRTSKLFIKQKYKGNLCFCDCLK